MLCYPKQLPHKVATNKTARPKVEDKLREVTDGTRMPPTVKPSMPLNSGKRMPEMSLDSQTCKKQKMSCGDCVAVNKPREAKVLVKPPPERGPKTSLDDQSWEKQKMGSKVRLECIKILKGLMDRRLSQAFSKPVDPVKTPDYFKTIKNPMDLGTIKRKLERNMYSASKEFADDMLLTFRNPMSYYPPSAEVYCSARLLNCNFKRMWGILDAKLKPVVEKNHQVTKPVLQKNHQVTKPAGLMKAPVPEKRGNARRTSVEKRLKSKLRNMNVKSRRTSLNGVSLISTIADKEPAIDARTRGAAPDDEKNPCSTSATTPASAEGLMDGVQMSPKKALRVAMLKSRFADTIFKATHPTLYEKTKLKAAEMPSRERERYAARMALEMVAKTAEIDRPPIMLQDMDTLFGRYPSSKSLEQIGLFVKENYVEEVDQ
ncbi:hypothetical protein AAHA92_11606 [Salvia divinorum]|uniref:Bromo domain-containing protein n=1 Tax=Salvia divinorum TaxID=28513 RepID=A0ABD1HLE5_SALDI